MSIQQIYDFDSNNLQSRACLCDNRYNENDLWNLLMMMASEEAESVVVKEQCWGANWKI